jgi:hypothetical protein
MDKTIKVTEVAINKTSQSVKYLFPNKKLLKRRVRGKIVINRIVKSLEVYCGILSLKRDIIIIKQITNFPENINPGCLQLWFYSDELLPIINVLHFKNILYNNFLPCPHFCPGAKNI